MCKRCSIIKNGSLEDLIAFDPSVLDTMKEGVDYISCAICGFRTRALQTHLCYHHHMKTTEYMEKYGKPIFCETELQRKSEQVKGEKNPGFQHGGKLSPFSEKNTSRTKEQIRASKEKAKKSIRESDKIQSKLVYWLNLCDGDEKKARKMLSERQRTFSLKKCIEKYGEEEGTRIWEERQKKWMRTLNSKSPEEMEVINRKKLSSGSISKDEQTLYEALLEQCPGLRQQVSISDSENLYRYDMCLGKRLIEYNGDYWHANKSRFSPDDILHFRKRAKVLRAKDIWDRDRKKMEFARNQGYEIMVVWEHQFKDDPESVISSCLEFLRG